MADILLVGVNYKKAGLQIREKLAFRPDAVPGVLSELSKKTGQAEIVLLSTCNRTEVYFYGEGQCCAEAAVRELLARHADLSLASLDEILYIRSGREAAHHLLQVACGLDSLVIGENEIQGQVRDALALAQSAGKAGAVLSALFRAATVAGKKVRTNTEIGEAKRSFASMVVHLAQEKVGSLQEKTALLVGAGKISSTTARALKGAGLDCILVANRTFERAQKLAEVLNARAVHFDALPEQLKVADIVICSTGAPHIVLHKEHVEHALADRPGCSLLLVDLAVPRDIDPAVACLPGVSLVDVDGLQSLVDENYPLSVLSRQAAEAQIAEELDRFDEWLSARQQAPLIQALREKADHIIEHQVELTLRRLGDITPEQRHSVEAMAHAIANQLLHEPIAQLKTPPQDIGRDEYIEVVENLFGLAPKDTSSHL